MTLQETPCMEVKNCLACLVASSIDRILCKACDTVRVVKNGPDWDWLPENTKTETQSTNLRGLLNNWFDDLIAGWHRQCF